MRDAAVSQQVFDRPDEADDEIEVRRRPPREPGRDPPRDRARRRLGRCGRARHQRARQRVGQRIQARKSSEIGVRPRFSFMPRFLRCAPRASARRRHARRFGVAHVDRQAHIREHRAERGEAQHDVVRAAAVAHQAPDLALERPEPGADLQAEFAEQRAAHFLLVHPSGHTTAFICGN